MTNNSIIFQIEVTNRCNFNCKYCIRNFWKAKQRDMDIKLFKKIISETNPEKLDLYGIGEPLLHPKFLEMVKLARDSKISFTTNGSLLKPRITDILSRDIDSISFSIDTLDPKKLQKIRRGSNAGEILRNFEYLLKVKNDMEIGINVVITKENFMDLPQIVKKAGEKGVDFVNVSHVVPYNKSIFDLAVFITPSNYSYEIADSVLDKGWDFIHDSIVEAQVISESLKDIEPKSFSQYKNIWKKAEKNGYWVNFPMLLEIKDKMKLLNEVKKSFEISEEIAKDFGVRVDLPEFFPDAKNRKCPYIEKKATIIRADGKIVPCFEFAYPHTTYVNMHSKEIKDVVFGDVNDRSTEEIWKSEQYRSFRELRRNIPENIPWCGDCVYSTLNCWFVDKNEDCYGNSPSCSECLYSMNIAKCVI